MTSPINRHDTDMILHQPHRRKNMAKGGQAGKGGKITLFFLIKWLKGIIICRFQRLAGTMIGVGLTITLLACLGIFIVSASVSMTKRAISMIPVDWQILLSNISSNADAEKVRLAIKKTTSCTALEKVGYADVSGLTASTGDTVQTTGPGKILGICPTAPMQLLLQSTVWQIILKLEFQAQLWLAITLQPALQVYVQMHSTPGYFFFFSGFPELFLLFSSPCPLRHPGKTDF